MKPYGVLVCCVLSICVCATHGAAQTASTAATEYVEVDGNRIAYPLVGSISRAQLIVLPEAGHGPQHQYPELSVKYIVAFLQSVAE